MHDLFKKKNRPKSTFITRILQHLYVPFLGGCIKHHLYDHKHDEFSRHVFVSFFLGGLDKYPLNVCQLLPMSLYDLDSSPKLVKIVTKPSLKKITKNAPPKKMVMEEEILVHLENQLLLISINFTPETSYSCLKLWYTMFSRQGSPSQKPLWED